MAVCARARASVRAPRIASIFHHFSDNPAGGIPSTCDVSLPGLDLEALLMELGGYDGDLATHCEGGLNLHASAWRQGGNWWCLGKITLFGTWKMCLQWSSKHGETAL